MTDTSPFDYTPRFPRGFSCASRLIGLKKEGRDLSLFACDLDAASAAVFTRNQFPGAPVVLGRETIRGGQLRGIVVNSKVSNVATGEEGLANARRMAAAAAKELRCNPRQILVSSTGVIGVQLPIEKIEAGITGMRSDLQPDPLVGAQGIMTTDTYAKALSMPVGNAVLTIVAKGAGMIEPNMATMLVYIFTDAHFEPDELDAMLRDVVDVTFNMLSVDSDTSTSDTCVIMASGLAGLVDPATFKTALATACTRMAEIIARDGEGATKLLRVKVTGAATRAEARTVAKSIVNSPLVKTMAHGADPNVGRLLMAVGKCFDVQLAPERTRCTINGVTVVENGVRAAFDEPALREELRGDPIDIGVELGVGDFDATAFGCDLTAGYIEENASYFSS